MSAPNAPAPTIRNPGLKPATPRKLFVTVPVADVQRSIDFFEALGFTFNARFTDEGGTAMLVGEDAYFMFATKERFLGLSKRPFADPRESAGALVRVLSPSGLTVPPAPAAGVLRRRRRRRSRSRRPWRSSRGA